MYSFDDFFSLLVASSFQYALYLFQVLCPCQFLEGDMESYSITSVTNQTSHPYKTPFYFYYCVPRKIPRGIVFQIHVEYSPSSRHLSRLLVSALALYDTELRTMFPLSQRGQCWSLERTTRPILQRTETTAIHCYTLQHSATLCNMLQHTATCCNTPQTHCNTLQHTASHCNTLQHTVTGPHTLSTSRQTEIWRWFISSSETPRNSQKLIETHRNSQQAFSSLTVDFFATQTNCNTLQRVATRCNTLQHAATHCNTLQHTATYCNILPYTAARCTTATHCNTLHHTARHPLY